MTRALALFLVAYWMALLRLSQGISVEYWDGFQVLVNGLHLVDRGRDTFFFSGMRPPLGWLMLAPIASTAYRLAGAQACLDACHAVMACWPPLLAWLSYRFFSRQFTPRLSAFLAALLALNPLLVRYAPFALFDVFSALASLPLLLMGERYLETPDSATFRKLLAAYVLAVLARYQCAPLILPLLACRWKDRRLWLLPPAALLAAGATLALAFSFASPGLAALGCVARAAHDLWRVVFENFPGGLVAKRAPMSVYLASLQGQYGGAGLFLAALGAGCWLAGGAARDRFRALWLLLPLAFMTFIVKTKEQRFLLAYLPILYAATGRGLETVARLARRRWPALDPRIIQAALIAALTVPVLPGQRDAWLFLAREPTLRSPVFAQLAQVSGHRSCVDWRVNDVQLRARDSNGFPAGDEQEPLFGPAYIAFFTARHEPEPVDCPAMLTVEAGPGEMGLRPAAGALGYVSRLSGDRKTRLWDITPEGLRRSP